MLHEDWHLLIQKSTKILINQLSKVSDYDSAEY